MELIPHSGLAETLVEDVKAECPSLRNQWDGAENKKTEHGDKLVLVATCAGKILIALSQNDEEAAGWAEMVAKVIEDIAKYQGSKGESKEPLPYAAAMFLMLEAFDGAENSSREGGDVQLFVKHRLADMHNILNSVDVWVSGGEDRNKDMEERRKRSVVFHGDIFHKPTPQYS